MTEMLFFGRKQQEMVRLYGKGGAALGNRKCTLQHENQNGLVKASLMMQKAMLTDQVSADLRMEQGLGRQCKITHKKTSPL